MSDRHITQKNTYFLQFMHSIPLDKLEDISVRADCRGKICRDNFCFCCSHVKFRSVRNVLLPPLPSHVVTSASSAVVTYLSRITFPKPSLFSKWILSSSCQAQEHYSLLPFEIQTGSKFHREGFLVCCWEKLPPPTKTMKQRLVNALSECSANVPNLRCIQGLRMSESRRISKRLRT